MVDFVYLRIVFCMERYPSGRGQRQTDHEAKGSSEHVHTDEWGRGTEKVVVHDTSNGGSVSCWPPG